MLSESLAQAKLNVITLTDLISVNDQIHSSCTCVLILSTPFILYSLIPACGLFFVNCSGKLDRLPNLVQPTTIFCNKTKIM